MGILLRSILNVPGCEDLKLIAGEKGLDREIRWTAVIGTIEFIKFCNEGDLNFVTGSEVYSEIGVLRLVRESYDNRMAGIVFAPGGPYMEVVPQEVIDFGNKVNFPIFTIPWESKISDWTKKIGAHILAGNRVRRSLEDGLGLILSGKVNFPISDELKIQLEEAALPYYEVYRVLLFHIRGREDKKNEDRNSLYFQLGKLAEEFWRGRGISIPLSDGYALILKGEVAKNLDRKDLHNFGAVLSKLQVSHDNIEFRIGAGDVYESIEGLSDSYKEASLVTRLISTETQLNKRLYFYEQLGAYRIIWECKNPKTIINFCEKHIGHLKTYDRINGTDLMDFLRGYYKYNSNVREISEKLYLHKNTVLYKIKKIESILNCNLAEKDAYFNIQLALMIDEICNEECVPAQKLLDRVT